MGGLSLGSAMSCCMAGDFISSRKGLLISYVRPAILHGSKAWCLKESDMGILRRTERSMCGIQFKDRKRCTDLMLMLGLSETIDQLSAV